LRSAGAWIEVGERDHRRERTVLAFRQPSHPDRKPLPEVWPNICLRTRSRVALACFAQSHPE
jgi:hypothetical protein